MGTLTDIKTLFADKKQRPRALLLVGAIVVMYVVVKYRDRKTATAAAAPAAKRPAELRPVPREQLLAARDWDPRRVTAAELKRLQADAAANPAAPAPAAPPAPAPAPATATAGTPDEQLSESYYYSTPVPSQLGAIATSTTPTAQDSASSDTEYVMTSNGVVVPDTDPSSSIPPVPAYAGLSSPAFSIGRSPSQPPAADTPALTPA